MKRFRFPLRPVAVLRTHRELKAREAFGAAVHAYMRSEQDLATVRERVARYEAELSAGRSGSFSAADQARALAAYRQERAAEAESERAMNNARTQMNQRRAEYLTAHRELEVVKRLEEKARTAYRGEVARHEQSEFDDFASRRALRRSPLPA